MAGDEQQEAGEFDKQGGQTIFELDEAGLEDHIEVIARTDGYEWKRILRSIQPISDKTDYYIDRVTEALDQRTLDDYDID